MAIRSAFFNSVNGDRTYGAASFAEYFATLIGNGVFPNPSTGLQVMSNNDMTVTVSDGKGWINGYIVIVEGGETLSLDSADGVLNRIDKVVLRYGTIERKIELKIKKGEFAVNPVAPGVTRNADYYELALADIYVSGGYVGVTQEKITDLRLNSAVCGIVHALIDQVDTTTIFNQYMAWLTAKQTEFNTFQTTSQTAFNTQYADNQTAFDNQLSNNQSAFNARQSTNQTEFNTQYENNQISFNDLLEELQENFEDWFSEVVEALGESAAGNLLNMVIALDNAKVDKDGTKVLSDHNYDIDSKNKVDAIPANPVYTDTVYTAGTNVSITQDNVISASGKAYTAGTNITISEADVISAKDTVYDDTDIVTSLEGKLSKQNDILVNYAEKIGWFEDEVVDLSEARVFETWLSSATTFSFINASINTEGNGGGYAPMSLPPPSAISFTLIIHTLSSLYSLTFPSSVEWHEGEIPDMSEKNTTYILTFLSINNGGTWYGMFGGEF